MRNLGLVWNFGRERVVEMTRLRSKRMGDRREVVGMVVVSVGAGPCVWV